MILLLSYDVRRRGGIERLTLQVKASLERQGQPVELLCPRPLGEGLLGRQLGRLRFLVALAWWLPQAAMVVSMHALLVKPVGWLNLLRPRKQRLLCWLHGIEVWGRALQPVARHLKACDGLIASSRFTRDRVIEQPDNWPPIHVVPPMADLIDPHVPPAPMPESMRLLTVARMDATERYKGHALVLDALDQLREEEALPANWQWRVAGDGNDRPTLEARAQALGLTPWVRFLGSLDDSDLEQELRHCSLLVMPSAYELKPDGRACGEGFGIVYLEAAQAGRASIACPRGGQADLIVDQSTGWLIPPDPKELARLLRQLAEHPNDLIAAGERARQRAISHFGQGTFDQRLRSALSTPATA